MKIKLGGWRDYLRALAALFFQRIQVLFPGLASMWSVTLASGDPTQPSGLLKHAHT